MAIVAAVTRSQVSQPAPESELPASGSEPDGDSSGQENAPVVDLSHYQKRCAAAYGKDPAFQDESLLSQYTNRHGLWLLVTNW